MPNKVQGQKNSDDVSKAWGQFQDLCDKHLPNQSTSITSKAYVIATKGSLWP